MNTYAKCEICHKPAEMDFNCLVPGGLKIPHVPAETTIVTGNICFECFAFGPSDLALAIAILQIRATGTVVGIPK